MINYTMNVQKLWTLPEQNGQSNVVVRVIFSYTGVSTQNASISHTVEDAVQLEYTGGAFTPFDQLTEAQVLAWVNAALPDEQRITCEAVIKNMINRKLNPIARPQAQQLPWG